ncbi:hypothetical protein MHF_0720 [Mycoplasma haemofelis Ohio2]|uniref:Uncharacterized protein n=1 Tax=Mycoplasma haemofelis (strain Ohio2) TaxID=859194 RepID=F6FIE2_MYCHI|nr:hypothetical protein MHF_0720 [Mycoplasma haemofelis Ohio2]
MNPAFAKGSLAFVATSGTVAGGAYLSGAFGKEDKSFRNYLKSIKRVEASTKEDWDTLNFLYAKESVENPIPNISKSSVSSDASKITKWCETKLTSDFVKSEADLVESWCSKPMKIVDRLPYFDLSPLNTSTAQESTTNPDDPSWASKSNSYQQSISDTTLKVNEVTDTTLGAEISSDMSVDKLKKWCG